MKIADFISLGFNRNEAIVYEALLSHKKSDAHTLIKQTKLHKNIVYDNLSKLIDRGLVTYIEEGGKRWFSITSAKALVQEVEQQELILKEKRLHAIKLQTQIEAIQKSARKTQEARILRGVRAIKGFYEQYIDSQLLCSLGAPNESVELMGEHFWLAYDRRRSQKNLKSRLIFNDSIRSHGDKIKDKFMQIRYFNKDFDPLTETAIFDDVVAIIVWTKEPILFLIEDENVVRAYLNYFEDMWKKAKL